MLSDGQIKATVLFKLHKRGNWGASHTAFENLKKGFKDEDLGKHAAKRGQAGQGTSKERLDCD